MTVELWCDPVQVESDGCLLKVLHEIFNALLFQFAHAPALWRGCLSRCLDVEQNRKFSIVHTRFTRYALVEFSCCRLHILL